MNRFITALVTGLSFFSAGPEVWGIERGKIQFNDIRPLNHKTIAKEGRNALADLRPASLKSKGFHVVFEDKKSGDVFYVELDLDTSSKNNVDTYQLILSGIKRSYKSQADLISIQEEALQDQRDQNPLKTSKFDFTELKPGKFEIQKTQPILTYQKQIQEWLEGTLGLATLHTGTNSEGCRLLNKLETNHKKPPLALVTLRTISDHPGALEQEDLDTQRLALPVHGDSMSLYCSIKIFPFLLSESTRPLKLVEIIYGTKNHLREYREYRLQNLPLPRKDPLIEQLWVAEDLNILRKQLEDHKREIWNAIVSVDKSQIQKVSKDLYEFLASNFDLSAVSGLISEESIHTLFLLASQSVESGLLSPKIVSQSLDNASGALVSVEGWVSVPTRFGQNVLVKRIPTHKFVPERFQLPMAARSGMYAELAFRKDSENKPHRSILLSHEGVHGRGKGDFSQIRRSQK